MNIRSLATVMLVPAVLATVLGTAVVAAGAPADLETYKDWNQSPQGYYMTDAERAQWNAIATDDAAAAFVSDFLAKRGPKFVDEVAKRAEMADKYLTIGKTKGSSTLRGKTIILFGPPAEMSVSDRASKSSYAPPPSSAGTTNLGVGASVHDGDGDSQTLGGGSRSGRAFRDYFFKFSAKTVPALGSDLEVSIEADAASGKDRVRDRAQAQALEEKFEAVAKASIIAK